MSKVVLACIVGAILVVSAGAAHARWCTLFEISDWTFMHNSAGTQLIVTATVSKYCERG